MVRMFKASPLAFFLISAIIACTCGPVARINEVRQTAESPLATAQAVATQAAEFGPTIQYGMTQAAELGPTVEAGLTEVSRLATQAGELAPELALTTTSIVATADALAGYGGGSSDIPFSSDGPINQWGATAIASSQRGSVEYSAVQTAGPPNTTVCGDAPTAWAGASDTGVESLSVDYVIPVFPEQIIIYESFNPGAVTRVEVVDPLGTYHVVYEGVAAPNGICPNQLVINVSGIPERINRVSITVDQSNHSGSAQIDAVELVGTP